mmetsp:Transcript_44905/g.113797  ORF Transcript_44905/g.113797 Transcript_44905/m.113797 type:complete len:189 (-) Transcript_44905:160-726(-)
MAANRWLRIFWREGTRTKKSCLKAVNTAEAKSTSAVLSVPWRNLQLHTEAEWIEFDGEAAPANADLRHFRRPVAEEADGDPSMVRTTTGTRKPRAGYRTPPASPMHGVAGPDFFLQQASDGSGGTSSIEFVVDSLPGEVPEPETREHEAVHGRSASGPTAASCLLEATLTAGGCGGPSVPGNFGPGLY